jgi:hypothetical protein
MKKSLKIIVKKFVEIGVKVWKKKNESLNLKKMVEML